MFIFISCGSLVIMLDFDPANLGSSPVVTHISCWWHQQGHPGKIAFVHQTALNTCAYPSFRKRECIKLKVLFLHISGLSDVYCC